MIEKLVAIFILINFLFGFSNEIRATSFEHIEIVSFESQATDSVRTMSSDHYQDCHKDGCHSHDTHCTHHCFGLQNLFETKQTLNLSFDTGIDSKIAWYFSFHYDEPFLDRALKPPLFS